MVYLAIKKTAVTSGYALYFRILGSLIEWKACRRKRSWLNWDSSMVVDCRDWIKLSRCQ